ncbi:hypothetical protein TNCV_725491 [Trichonephila clavipes]|nr:hypothetical protein TNCV_725491 [Trichonephila clavipes]
MVSEWRVHDEENIVKLFVQTLFVLQSTPILHSGIMTTTFFYSNASNMPVLSADRDRGPLRTSTALSITVQNPSIPYSANDQLDREGPVQQYCDTINRNTSSLQFDLYRSQKRDGKHFYFLHEASQKLFTRQ